jgi:opacity protein-like surface antigen
MTRKVVLTLAAIALVAVAVPAQAQSSSTSSPSGVVVAVQGGGFSSVANLNDANTADFKTGFNVGGSLGYDVNRIVGVRGTFTFAQSDTRGTLNIEVPNSNVSIFAEGGGWFYKFDHFGFDKTQFDLTWSAGLSYRFGR